MTDDIPEVGADWFKRAELRLPKPNFDEAHVMRLAGLIPERATYAELRLVQSALRCFRHCDAAADYVRRVLTGGTE
jgi:hypothetical protein